MNLRIFFEMVIKKLDSDKSSLEISVFKDTPVPLTECEDCDRDYKESLKDAEE